MEASTAEAPTACQQRCTSIQAFCKKVLPPTIAPQTLTPAISQHFLPLGFLLAIVLGLAAPVLGKTIGEPKVSHQPLRIPAGLTACGM